MHPEITPTPAALLYSADRPATQATPAAAPPLAALVQQALNRQQRTRRAETALPQARNAWD